MTKEELKQYIDQNIYENVDGDISGDSLNEILKAIVDDGGTKVEANPTGEATTPLNKIKIGETNYNIPQTDTSNLVTEQELAEELGGYVRKTDPPSPAADNLVAFNEYGGFGDSGKKVTDFATRAQGEKAETAVQPAALETLATKQELQQGLSDKQDTIADLEQIRTRADEGHTALQPLSGAQENNFASFDSNGGIKDSGCNESTFIKGVKQNGTLITPVSGVVDVTVQDGQNGLSAFEIAQQQGYTGTVDQWLASLKANIGAFKFVSYDQSAESAFTTGGIGTTYSNTIDSLVAGNDTTPDVILLMNNTDGTTQPTKTFMIATQETTTAGTYEFIYAGDLQSAMSSNVLTEDDVDDTQLVNPVSGSLAKAEDVMQLKAKLEGFTLTETKVNPTVINLYRISSTGLVSASDNFSVCEINLNGAHVVRFLAAVLRSGLKEHTNGDTGYDWGHYENGSFVVDGYTNYNFNTTDTFSTEEVVKKIKSPSTHVRITCKVASALDGFYCYIQDGYSVEEYVKKEYPLTILKDFYRKSIDINGNLANAGDGARIGVFSLGSLLDDNNVFEIKTNPYKPSNNTLVSVACYSSDVISSSSYLGNLDYGLPIQGDYDNYVVPSSKIPAGTKYIAVFKGYFTFPVLSVYGANLSINSVEPHSSCFVSSKGINDALLGNIEPQVIEPSKTLKSDGTNGTATLVGASLYTFVGIDSNYEYYASGYSPAIYGNGTSIAVGYFGDSDVFLGGQSPADNLSGSNEFFNFKLTVPSGTKKIKIFGAKSSEHDALPQLRSSYKNIVNTQLSSMIVPQIYNGTIHRRSLDEPIKILCFGSSWFMNTWWYLNKITASAGVNAEIHSYYLGSGTFSEWLQLYNNSLAPLPSGRNARKCISTNGSDWTISIFGSNYTAQQFRDDFYNDLTSQDWDFIITQQGAKASIVRAEWDSYEKDFISMIKSNCNCNTIIGFNSTWTPGLDNSWLTGFEPNSYDGQSQWQRINWDNTKSFMMNTGISNICPNGALMRILQANTTLINTPTANDLYQDDDLHPANGLPNYALCGCLYQTYIAPMFGVDFNEVDWLPDSSTQKASVSGSSFMAISSEQRDYIRKAIHLALSDRFAIRSL